MEMAVSQYEECYTTHFRTVRLIVNSRNAPKPHISQPNYLVLQPLLFLWYIWGLEGNAEERIKDSSSGEQQNESLPDGFNFIS